MMLVDVYAVVRPQLLPNHRPLPASTERTRKVTMVASRPASSSVQKIVNLVVFPISHINCRLTITTGLGREF